VRYFVKATPARDPVRVEKAGKYGVPFERPLRYAMCDVWKACKVGYSEGGAHGAEKAFQDRGPWQQVVHSMQEARVCSSAGEVRGLLKRVKEGAALYRVKMDRDRVRLGGKGGFSLVAVPLEQSLQHSDWRVQPMVCITPAASPITVRSPSRQVSNALTASGKEYHFFTHTFGMSGF
jgi:hypothetical protein